MSGRQLQVRSHISPLPPSENGLKSEWANQELYFLSCFHSPKQSKVSGREREREHVASVPSILFLPFRRGILFRLETERLEIEMTQEWAEDDYDFLLLPIPNHRWKIPPRSGSKCVSLVIFWCLVNTSSRPFGKIGRVKSKTLWTFTGMVEKGAEGCLKLDLASWMPLAARARSRLFDHCFQPFREYLSYIKVHVDVMLHTSDSSCRFIRSERNGICQLICLAEGRDPHIPFYGASPLRPQLCDPCNAPASCGHSAVWC